MPRFEITSPDGRRFEVEAPPGATREQALRMVQQQLAAPETAPTPAPKPPGRAGMIRALLPGSDLAPLLGAIEGGITLGPAGAKAGLESDGGKAEIAGAVIGSMLGGPIGARAGAILPRAATIAGRVAQAVPRAALRTAPRVSGAGVGGGMGGAATEAGRGGTPESILQAGLESGERMAVAEMMGTGIATAGRTALAPASTFPVLRSLDFGRPIRDAVRRISRELPSRTRDAIKAAEQSDPGRGAAIRAARENVQRLARRVTEKGEVSSRRLREEWERLTTEQRSAFGSFEQFASGVTRVTNQVARLSKTVAGQEVLDRTLVPLTTAALGPGAGVVLWGVKQTFAPGPLVRHFARDVVPGGAAAQTVLGQSARSVPRAAVESDQ